jgi:hypothetical protein
MQLVTLRIEIERELRSRLETADGATGTSRLEGIGPMLKELRGLHRAPIITEKVLRAISASDVFPPTHQRAARSLAPSHSRTATPAAVLDPGAVPERKRRR